MTASESRPGNRSVVHHILVFAVPPGSTFQEQFVKGHLIAAFAPGVPRTRCRRARRRCCQGQSDRDAGSLHGQQ